MRRAPLHIPPPDGTRAKLFQATELGGLTLSFLSHPAFSFSLLSTVPNAWCAVSILGCLTRCHPGSQLFLPPPLRLSSSPSDPDPSPSRHLGGSHLREPRSKSVFIPTHLPGCSVAQTEFSRSIDWITSVIGVGVYISSASQVIPSAASVGAPLIPFLFDIQPRLFRRILEPARHLGIYTAVLLLGTISKLSPHFEVRSNSPCAVQATFTRSNELQNFMIDIRSTQNLTLLSNHIYSGSAVRI